MCVCAIPDPEEFACAQAKGAGSSEAVEYLKPLKPPPVLAHGSSNTCYVQEQWASSVKLSTCLREGVSVCERKWVGVSTNLHMPGHARHTQPHTRTHTHTQTSRMPCIRIAICTCICCQCLRGMAAIDKRPDARHVCVDAAGADDIQIATPAVAEVEDQRRDSCDVRRVGSGDEEVREARQFNARLVENSACALSTIHKHLKRCSCSIIARYLHPPIVFYMFSPETLSAHAHANIGILDNLKQRCLLSTILCNAHNRKRNCRACAFTAIAHDLHPCHHC